MTEYIDMTPTWESLVPVFIDLLQGKNAESRKLATEEITRMAKMADILVKEWKQPIANETHSQ